MLQFLFSDLNFIVFGSLQSILQLPLYPCTTKYGLWPQVVTFWNDLKFLLAPK